MPISGLVLTLSHDAEARAAALAHLAADDRVTVGETPADAPTLPIVTETLDANEHERLWHEVAALEGVLQVRLAFHDFSDVHDFGTGAGARRARRRATLTGG